MQKVVHIVPHSHWDREWYFTTSRSKVYLMKDMYDVLETLENDKNFSYFILDGQASLIDDYLKWRPQDFNRIKALVQNGKLIIGPWYTQTDQLVISGESIIRNMQYGMRICEIFGNYMNVGYVPDSFGHSANMPQIYKEFGIQDTLFWRGVSDDDVKNTEYLWQGDDGSEVNVFQIPLGYYIGGGIPEDEQELARMMSIDPMKTIVERASTKHVYFPNGFDQAPIRKNLPFLVEKMNELYENMTFKISNIETYITAVKEEKPNLEMISNELVNGKLSRIHKTIFSSRSDLKILNTQVQNYIVNTLEPLLSISQALGFEYPVETMREVWKLMFENAAHDSIGSCVSDTTNEDVYMRYKQARDISVNLAELTMREISTRITNEHAEEITYTIFNTLDTERSGVVEVDIYTPSETFGIVDDDGKKVSYSVIEMIDQTDYVKTQTIKLNPSKEFYIPEKVYKATIAISVRDIPSIGYKQLTVKLDKNSHEVIEEALDNIIENAIYKITINTNGTLDILEKKSNILYKNQAVIEENGDDGDSFNYSPPRKDMIISSENTEASIKTYKSTIRSYAVINFDLIVPKTLEERAEGNTSVCMPVEVTVTLDVNSKIIDFKLWTDNSAYSHRLCALFSTGIASSMSIADQQFGIKERPVFRTEEMKLWEQSPEKWNEKPIAIETCQSFVALDGNTQGVAIVPKGVREYEIIGETYDTIRITLFRTYGFMGRENLLYRPGRASGEKIIETPDAQLIGSFETTFSAYYYHGSFNEAHVGRIAKEANTPFELYQYAEFLNGRLIFSLEEITKKTFPAVYSLFAAETNLVLSAVNKAETRNGIILRYYNAQLHTNESIKISTMAVTSLTPKP